MPSTNWRPETSSKTKVYFEGFICFSWKNAFLIPTLFLGIATIKVRVPDKTTGGRLITIRMKLDASVEDLYAEIGGKLDLNPNR